MGAIEKRNAAKIYYYLMYVDGKVTDEEIGRFEEIGKEIDEDFEKYKDEIIKECKEQISKAKDSRYLYDRIQEGVENELKYQFDDCSWNVSAKLIVWNMLTIAYSDQEYAETERNLIKYVACRTNVDSVYLLEMENLLKAAKAVEKEKEWIKTTDKPYEEIHTIVDELDVRKATIFNSVKQLIQD